MSFVPVQGTDELGPYTTFAGQTLERPFEIRVSIDSMDAHDGFLTIRGRFPATFTYGSRDLTLHVGEHSEALTDQGRYADTILHGQKLARARTFTARVPLHMVCGRLEFRLETKGEVSPPLPIHFNGPISKLSHKSHAYWAIPGTAILTSSAENSVQITPYSKLRHARAEGRRQLALRMLNTPEHRAIARLRLKYFLTRPSFRKRRIWMYADRIVKGGDNGEYAFRYAVTQRDGIEKHYVLQPGTTLATHFRDSSLPFLAFGTDKQRLHYLNAEVVFATRLGPAATFGLQQHSQGIRDLLNSRTVYMNHGLVVDKLDFALNVGYTGFDRICVVSEGERSNLTAPNYGYATQQVVSTGFARYDGLHSSPNRTILLAPTWRANLHRPQRGNATAEEHRAFRQTPYFHTFNSLINNPRLHQMLHDYDFRLVFLLHPNVGSQLSDFSSTSDRVEIHAATDDVSYEQLLTQANIMVTDYSGVQFDFAHMGKPLVYFHPPRSPHATARIHSATTVTHSDQLRRPKMSYSINCRRI
ncbi:hypothetical protein G7066_13335 [Leucobacter coleopterorum]|uniref:CDP-Glycerol:Poly(Glycerophosphate) glycerophosphotransferase n=1 Tax=Leucobacter coleopterorum TaxID=2714933 RepID=A0ABX6JZG6_9MICO|nr:CDP-glycerol glycerophosphotransferase family protein [Leucobacter coleopterorum]QIM19306.1 hypothetical protein G7066_13335 [Leucobacter coleopterorum]